MGQPMEHVLRQSLIALRLGERLGLDESERVVVYYVGLLAWVGCHVDAYEQAKWFGDDTVFKGDCGRSTWAGRCRPARSSLGHLGSSRPLIQRARPGIAFLGGRPARGRRTWSRTTGRPPTSSRRGLEPRRRGARQPLPDLRALGRQGRAGGGEGRQIQVAARLVNLADVVEVFHRAGGIEAAMAVARERSGTQFDPDLVDAVLRRGAGAVRRARCGDELGRGDRGRARAGGGSLRRAARRRRWRRSPTSWTSSRRGRSAIRAAWPTLAAEAARGLGLSDDDVVLVRRAGLVHDLGRLGVSNAIWDKRGPLSRPRARARAPAPLSDRANAGVVAGAGAAGGDRRPAPRAPRRVGLPARARRASAMTRAGQGAGRRRRLPRDDRAAPAPPGALGRRRPRRSCAPGCAGRGSTPKPSTPSCARLVTRSSGGAASRRADRRARSRCSGCWCAGCPTRRSRRSWSSRARPPAQHVEHIYTKLGVSNRARASLFAMKHGLMGSE